MEDGVSMLQIEQHEPSSPIPGSPSTALDNKDAKTAIPEQSLVSAPSLRKSVSVDSFSQYNRETPAITGLRPNRGYTSSALEPPRTVIYGVSSSLKEENGEESQASLNHGTSSTPNKNAEPNSDLERSDSLKSPVVRYRHNSLLPQDQTKPFMRGGELQPLPLARTPTLSTASSLSTNSTRLDDAPRSQSSSSLQQIPRRGTLPALSSPSRARSGSLGMYSSAPLRRSAANGAISDIRNVDPTVTLVVVGSAGCGKSTVIRKGLKRFALSEPIACPTISGIPGLASVTNYIRRTGRVGQLENVIDCPLKVLEASAQVAPGSSPIRHNPILDPVPRVDGAVICYDASNPSSFVPLDRMLSDYSAMRIPILVLACKSDLTHRVDSSKAHNLCKIFDVGVIEVNHETEKERIALAFEFLLQAVWRDRRDKRQGSDVKYRNPASPKLLKHHILWHTSGSTSSVAVSPLITVDAVSREQNITAPVPQSAAPSISLMVNVPSSEPRSLGEPSNSNWKRGQPLPYSKPYATVRNEIPVENVAVTTRGDCGDASVEKPDPKDLKPALYMTLDELLDKLLFLSVSADDPSFITHFLLTYRRFATPRNVLLTMQKRMRQLDSLSADPMFACFAQMRICALLEAWIKDYPYDFAVRGTAGALSALIKSILSKTYLLHYGSELLPFLEALSSYRDDDSAWALKVHVTGDTSDSESALDDEEIFKPLEISPNVSCTHPSAAYERAQPARERKSSLPLTKALKQVVAGLDPGDLSIKQKMKELVKLSHEVMLFDPEVVAQEITRLQAKLFLRIQPRHWLHLTFVGKNEFSETISASNSFSNHLAEWVLSLILCHEKPRTRARQVEKFAEIATKLRHLNNYSALRAFIAGIHSSTYATDETIELFRNKCPEQYKSLQSWDLLFRPVRSHRAYRTALKNSKGGCIPALEVHIQDLIRAHEGNPDAHVNDSSKIHWGKFNLIGKFIVSTTQCQIQCRNAVEYQFPDRADAVERLLRYPLMTEELKKMRLPLEYLEFESSAVKVTPVRTPPSLATSYKATASTQPTHQTLPPQRIPAQPPSAQARSQPVVSESVSPKTTITRPHSAQNPSTKPVFAGNPTRSLGFPLVHELQYW